MMAVIWERCSSIVIVLIALWTMDDCQAATHWIVTEHGRIEQHANSLFNLQKPFDLVSFIQQEQRLNKIQLLQHKLDQEQKILDQVNKQEKEDISQSFFKTDLSCSKIPKRFHELDPSLNYILSFSSKGINLASHIDLVHPLSTNKMKTPTCGSDLPSILLTFDHLRGVANRHVLPSTVEPGLLSTMPYITDVSDWGQRVYQSLQMNSSSWVLQNMAATFWRIKGNTLQAMNCLRGALYNSPREHKDIALLAMAIVLHNANYSLDSLILLHASLENTKEYALHHYILGTIYASLQMFEMAELCFQYVTKTQPDYTPALERFKCVVCERRYIEALDDQHRMFEQNLKKLKAFSHNHQSFLQHKSSVHIENDLPLQQYRRQLQYLTKTHTTNSKGSPVGAAQEQLPVIQLNDQQMQNLQREILNAVEKKKVTNNEAFTLNIQLEHGHINNHEQFVCRKTAAQAIPTTCAGSPILLKKENKTMKDKTKSTEKKEESRKKTKSQSRKKKKSDSHESKSEETQKTRQKSSKDGNPSAMDVTSSPDTSRGERRKASGKHQTTNTKPPKTDLQNKRFSAQKKVKSHKENKKITGQKKDKGEVTLEAKTRKQLEHARATLARVRKVLSNSAAENPYGTTGRLDSTAKTKYNDQHIYTAIKDNKRSGRKEEFTQLPSADSQFSKLKTEPSEGPVADPYQPEGSSDKRVEWMREQCGNPVGSTKGRNAVKACEDNVPSGITKNMKSNLSTDQAESPQRLVQTNHNQRPAAGRAGQMKAGRVGPKLHTNNDKQNLTEKQASAKDTKIKAKRKKREPEATTDNRPDSGSSSNQHRTTTGNAGIARGTPGLTTMRDELPGETAPPLDERDPGDEEFDGSECQASENMEILLKQNYQFSVFMNMEAKGVDVSQHLDLNEDTSSIPKPPRCLAEVRTGHQSFDHLKGVMEAASSSLPRESSLTQTFLSYARGRHTSVEDLGTRIHRALKKDPSSWVLLNLASLFWRIMGDNKQTIHCLRLAIYHSPAKSRDVALVNLASILFRAGYIDDAVTICKAVLQIYPNTVISHFILGNALAAQGKVTQATTHLLVVLQLEPGFVPAVERLKVIQCILWRQQQELEKEAEELRKLLTAT